MVPFAYVPLKHTHADPLASVLDGHWTQVVIMLELTVMENILTCHASVKPPSTSPDTAVPLEIKAISIGVDVGTNPADVTELLQDDCPPGKDVAVYTV